MNNKFKNTIIAVLILILAFAVILLCENNNTVEYAETYKIFEPISDTVDMESIAASYYIDTEEATTTTVATKITTDISSSSKETTTTITTTIPITTTITTKNTTTESVVSETEITTTVTTKKNSYYFYKDSMRVHTSDCIYADPSCMEEINGNYIDEARPCQICNPDIIIGNIYEPPVVENTGSSGFERNWSVSEMTYYSGGYGCYGASGRTLVNNYSVACNSIPLGTIVYIKSSDGSIDGYYRVDDTGQMGGHVIDIFYSSYSNVPKSFRNLGRVSCEVYIVG